jgi:hypothetical protein
VLRGFALAVVALASCTGTDPVSDCNDHVAALCQQFFQCASKSEIAGKPYKTESDCEVYGQGAADCADAAKTVCPNGGTYDSTVAQQCVSDIGTLSCADVRANKAPASCAADAQCK